MVIQCENIIKLIRNSSKGEQREAIICDFPANEVKMNMNVNGQGYTMYNTIWQGSYAQEARLLKNDALSLIDSVEVVNIQDEKLGLAKIPSNFSCEKTHNDTFEYEQIIFSLVKEVKQLKEEINLLK